MIPEYNDNMKVVVVYHGGCLDGITGSWVTQHYFTTLKNKQKEDITLIGMSPQCINLLEELEKYDIKLDTESCNMIFVDICPTIEVLRSIIVLNKKNNNKSRFELYDHHITNKDIFTKYKNVLFLGQR